MYTIGNTFSAPLPFFLSSRKKVPIRPGRIFRRVLLCVCRAFAWLGCRQLVSEFCGSHPLEQIDPPPLVPTLDTAHLRLHCLFRCRPM